MMAAFFAPALPHRAALLRLAVACALATTACAHRTSAASPKSDAAHTEKAQQPVARDAFRTQVPAPEAAPVLHLPIPHETVLDNGLKIWTHAKQDLPLVVVLAVVKSGSAQDPAGAQGLASLAAEVARRGTGKRTAEQIAEAVENVGGHFDVSVDDDATTFSVSAMTQHIGPVLDVLADVLMDPAFLAKEVERVRTQRLAELMQVESEPRASVNTVFRKVAFGDHAYGHSNLGTIKSVRSLKTKAIKAFYRAHVRPANTSMVVVGDLTNDDAVAAIASRLGTWHGAQGEQAPPAPPAARTPEIALVDRPDAPQSQVVVGGLGLARDDADYYPVVLGNAVLGGLFNSRLNMNLREDKGWTYGVRSSFNFMRAKGPFVIGAGVRTDVTVAALGEIFKEIDRMRAEPISDDELTAAKNRYTLSLPGNFQSLGGIASMLSTQALYDLPATYYRDLPEALGKVTVQDIQRVMADHVVPNHLSIVVVGDSKHLTPGLIGLKRGAVHLRDTEGNLLANSPSTKLPKH